MIFEWDEAKRTETIRVRGLDFGTAWRFFDGRPVVHISSPRSGEGRWKTTAIIEGAYFTLVWVWRGAVVRIISLRRGHGDEEKAHRALHD
jgi:uncharacterized DUF497 family protein